MHQSVLLTILIVAIPCDALNVCGLQIPIAKYSPASRALDELNQGGWPESFPFSEKDLTPMMPGNDQLFYLIPKFVHHAGEECRDSLSQFYAAVL